MHRLHAVVEHFVQFLGVGLAVTHAEIVVDFVGHDFPLGNHHGLDQIEVDFLAVRLEQENLFDFFAHQLGVGAQGFGQILAGILVDGLLEMGGDDRGYPVGHLVGLGLVVFLLDFARLFQGLVEFRVGGESLEVQQKLALGAMPQPFGQGFGVVCLEGFGLAYHYGLFRTEHGHGVAGGHYRFGNGRDVRVRGVQDLLGKRVVFPFAQGIGNEFLDADVLGKLVLANEGYNHPSLAGGPVRLT